MRGSAGSGDDVRLAVHVEEHGSACTVRVAGEVDMLAGSDFADAVLHAVRSATDAVEIDLRAVTYFGSEGVQTLVRGEALARDRSVVFRIAAVAHRRPLSRGERPVRPRAAGIVTAPPTATGGRIP